MTKETRCFTELRVETRDDGRSIIRGLPIVFNSLSEDLGGFRERVHPEAVKRTLAEDDIRGLFNHDPNQILGRTKASTMRLRATKDGVEMEIDLPDTAVGRVVGEGIRRGDISGGSFGFTVTKDEWEERDGQMLRTLRDLTIYDVGPVVFPAYPETSMAVRAFEAWRATVTPPAPPPDTDQWIVEADTRRRALDLLRASC